MGLSEVHVSYRGLQWTSFLLLSMPGEPAAIVITEWGSLG